MTSPVSPGNVLLGKYCVERVLGKGGMGVVVAARHMALGELFAIKFLLPTALASAGATERFLREARASARLKSEHVVKVQDVGTLPDGAPYMVMEHLSGSDLKDVVRRRGPLPVPEAITYVLQACDALAEAHSLGIVHRDLKPANMFLIRRPNGSPCVKVLDFGISKQLYPENPEHHTLTQTGVVLGSPAFMSPEQITRTKEADPRSDIWSMGVVLYQLLTGMLPFRSDALTELIAMVLQEDPAPPSRHRPDLPSAVDAVVRTCLQKPRQNRFQTTLQLMEALRAALNAGATSPSSLSTGAVSPREAVKLVPLPETVLRAPAPSERSVTAPLPLAPSTAGAVRPPQSSQAFLEDGSAVQARPSFPSRSDDGADAPARAALGASSGGAALTERAVQTGQAWGTTQNRAQPPPPPKPGYAVVIAAVALLMLSIAAVLAVWQYRDSPSATTAASSAPVSPTISMNSTAVSARETPSSTTKGTGAAVGAGEPHPTTAPTRTFTMPLPAMSETSSPTMKPTVVDPTRRPTLPANSAGTPSVTGAAAGASVPAAGTVHPKVMPPAPAKSAPAGKRSDTMF